MTSSNPLPIPPEQAVVEALLPQRLFRLKTEDDVTIIAGLAPTLQRTGALPLVGQRVSVQRMQLDPGRGLIVGLAARGSKADVPASS